MKVCVAGLWHLGTVTAACLASIGHEVAGLDPDRHTIEQLALGKPPLFEPGLEELVNSGLNSGKLRFTSDIREALTGARVVWVTYDTPVDEEDRADVDFVKNLVVRLFPYLEKGSLVLISSQLPVGSTAALEKQYQKEFPDKPVGFSYSPENLRLGKAIQIFTRPDRIVFGVRSEPDKKTVHELVQGLTERIEWMSVESAEMTKHALNAFLAVSVTFANEIAVLCEKVGADAKEVERGLKSEERIGPRAYLSPGGAFAGGTLARDIAFLSEIGAKNDEPVYLISSVRMSNENHKDWIKRKLKSALGQLDGRKAAIWGLTYKPGTNTLRRSSSVELCLWLSGEGTIVQAHDPAVKNLPEDLAKKIRLFGDPLSALKGADILVVATEWPDYKSLPADGIVQSMGNPVVIDVNRFLMKTLGNSKIKYITVGSGRRPYND